MNQSRDTRGALALVPDEPRHGLKLLTYPAAVEVLHRSARLTRREAFAHLSQSPRRNELLEEARAFDALAANLGAFAPDVERLNLAMQRAIEMALAELDEQINYGVPRENQHIHYARIFAAVRAELAEREAEQ